MLVKSVLSRMANLARLSHLAEAGEPASKKTAETTASNGSSAANSAALREIVSEYDVTKISPRAFSDMLQKLHQAGAVSDAEFQDLSMIRLDLDKEGLDPDKGVNLVELYADRLKRLRREREDFPDSPEVSPPAMASAQRRLEWLQKVATIQSPHGAGGVDKTV